MVGEHSLERWRKTEGLVRPRRLMMPRPTMLALVAMIASLTVPIIALDPQDASAADPYSDAVLASNPVAYWRFEETTGSTAPDSSASNITGTYQGSPQLATPGIVLGSSSGVLFQGGIDGLDLPDAAAINIGSVYAAKTVELWFNANDVTTRQMLYEQGGISRGISMYVDQGFLYAGAWNPMNDDATTPWGPLFVSTSVSPNTTYHAVFVFDAAAGLVEGYLNGGSFGSQSGAGNLFPHSNNSGIGATNQHVIFHDGYGAGDGEYFNGVIDEVALYNAALGATTIADHYGLGSSPPDAAPLVAISSPPAGPVSGVVTVVVDASDAETAPGALGVEVSFDGGLSWLLATHTGGTSYERSWDTASITDGLIGIVARATDSAPQTVESAPVLVDVDNVDGPPSVSISAPASGTVLGTVIVEVDAFDQEDPQPVLAVTVSTDDGATWSAASWNGIAFTYSWNTTLQADGPAVIVARAEDTLVQAATSDPVAVSVVNSNPNLYADTVLADGPVAYWRLGEASGSSAFDASGNNIIAAYVGGPNLGMPALVSATPDPAVGLDGVDDAVYVPQSSLINLGPPRSERTVEIWF